MPLVKMFVELLLGVIMLFIVAFGATTLLLDTILSNQCTSYGKTSEIQTKYIKLDACYTKAPSGVWERVDSIVFRF